MTFKEQIVMKYFTELMQSVPGESANIDSYIDDDVQGDVINLDNLKDSCRQFEATGKALSAYIESFCKGANIDPNKDISEETNSLLAQLVMSK